MTRCLHESRQGRSGVLEVLRWRGVRTSVLAGVLMVATGVRLANAANITVYYDSTFSVEPDADPFGVGLTAIVNAAANHWEHIITDPVTIDVTISWKNTLSSNTIANALVLDHDGSGRPISGRIHFNKDFDFYYDATPENDDEYNMQQELYRDLTPAQQSSWFNGSPPPVLEYGYRGDATGSAPADAQDFCDLFTVALHELGHIVGMNGYTAWLQLADGDYDFSPAFIGGATAAVVDDDHHLLVAGALMFPSINTGRRVRPSATDIFAIASTPVLPWSGIELPRLDFLGGVNLSDPAAWTGGKTPGVIDDAYVRVNGTSPPMAATTGNMVFGSLNVREGSWVTTNHTLDVTGTTTIDASLVSPGGTSRIRVQPSGSLVTGDLVIGPSAVLHLLGGYVGVDDDALVTTDGLIQGEGMMFVQGRLTNDGLIRADGFNLTLSTWSSGAIWDLDGAGGGALEAIDGDMFIYGAHIGSFHGTVTIGANRELELAHPWWFGDNGYLTLDGGPGSPATLLSTDSRLRGTVIVHGTGIVEGKTTFQAPAIVSIPDAPDILELHDEVVFDGGSYTGAGTIKQMGNIDVNSDTKIDVHLYDWGNSSIFQVNETVISPGATFHVNSSNIATPGNPYHGTMLVSGGTLLVTTASFWTLPAPTVGPLWRSGGTLNLIESGGQPARVQGQTIMVQHKIDAILGTNIIEADLVTTATAEIQVRNGADLQLAGHTTLNGGNIHGDGTLDQRGDITVAGQTAIDTAVFDWGNSAGATIHTLAIQPGARLNVNSPTTGDGANSFRGAIDVDSGTLAVNTLAPWTLAGDGATLPQGALTLSRTGTEKPSVTGIASMVVAGALNIDADEAFFESTMVLQGGKVTFLADGEMQHVAPVQFHDGTFDHAHKAGWFRTSPSAGLAWAGNANITVEGGAGGSLTFDLASGTTVTVPAISPTLTIDPGATVNLAGATDPFTDSLDPALHVNVVNDSTTSLNVVAGAKAVGTLSGGGNTFVASGAGLAAEAVVQNHVSIAAGGTLQISVPGSSILLRDALDNAGLMSFSGDIDVMGEVINAGDIIVSRAATARFFNAVAQNREFFVPAGSTAVFFGDFSGNGCSGGGTVFLEGDTRPGASPGTMNFGGDVVFGALSNLHVELDDLTAGTEYDQVNVAGSAALAGNLDVQLAPAYVPLTGRWFDVLTAGSRSGTFAGPEATGYAAGKSLVRAYDAAGLSILATWNGDATCDGAVDISDLSVLAGNYRATVGELWGDGDFNGDGAVDISDLAILAGNYRKTAEVGGAPIPEPVTLGLLALGGLAVLRKRRR